jgi:hypothetical protein
MQRNRFASYLLAFALGALYLAGASLQAQPPVLAQGHPPLTSEIRDKVNSFFEWALDVQFTPAQKQEYEAMLVSEWADASKRKSTLQAVEIMDQLATLPPDTREQAQMTIRRTLLDSLRKESQDRESRWMLTIYDAAHPGEVT